MTVLKPLHGLESGLLENLASFCDQAYPSYQVIFGVQRADDPAVDVVKEVVARYPHCEITLAIAQRAPKGNAKVANLASMMRYAKHPLIVISDADMRVGSDYLATIAADFADERVGAVTALYAGSAAQGTASRLGAMHINEQFIPSVLVATMFSPPTFCFGSTMAVRTRVLDEIGGMGALEQYLADDYMLGSLAHQHGYRVALSPYVVSNVVYEPNLQTLWHHEVRWARTIFAQQPLGFAFSFVTIPLPFALLFALSCGSAVAGASALLAVFGLRVWLARRMRGLLRADERSFSAWLIPLRDLIALSVWAAGLLGRDVRWRDRAFNVDKDGKI